MAKKTKSPFEVPPDFVSVAAAFAKDKQVSSQKGWGTGSVQLKVNGKIFVMFEKGSLVAKLPKSRVDELVDQGTGQRFDPRGDGRLMKEWVVVGRGKEDWIRLATEAYHFVRSL